MNRRNPNRRRKTKYSVVVAHHKTSLSIEDEFLDVLREMAFLTETSVNKVVEKIEAQDRDPNLTRACRLAALQYLRMRVAQLAGARP